MDMTAAQPPELRLAHLLVTRICHDISNPLHGLGAALGELPGDPQALPLAVDAAHVLRQRIALLRAAWGDEPPALARDGLLDLARGLPNASRLQVVVDGLSADAPFQPAATRLLVNVMLLAAESLPAGGMLALTGAPGGTVVAAIAGRQAAWPAGFGALLASADAAWTALGALRGVAGLRGVQAPLTALLAHQAGVRAALLMATVAEAAPPLLLDLSGMPPA